MAIQQKPQTIEEFDHFVNLPENADRRLEFLYGNLIERALVPTTYSNKRDILMFFVRIYCEQNGIACYTSGSGGSYRIRDDEFMPDFAYKREKMSGEYPDRIPPLWVAEFILPDDTAFDVADKRHLCFDNEILFWEIYPEEPVIDIYAPGQPLRSVGIDGMLDGGDVLPEFTLAMKDLFRG